MKIETPFGLLWASINEAGELTALRFGGGGEEPSGMDSHAVRQQIEDYCAGKRHAFDLPLAPRGTEFQKRVWQELVQIPYGQTISYAELAKRVGSAGAARAVGRANATNPIALVVPCHRVIGANGTLTGYAYGVELKRALLDFERGQVSL